MQITLRDELAYVEVEVIHHDRHLVVSHVILDTGSARTILSADLLAGMSIHPSPDDVLYLVTGVGGTEAVFARTVDGLRVGERLVPWFELEVGAMDYGFPINGILGMDFLVRTAAVVDLGQLTIEFPRTEG